MSGRVTVAAVMAGVCVMAGLPSAATAGGKAEVKVTVEFQAGPGQPVPHLYVGKVKSDKGKCKNERTVKLFGPADNLITKGKSGKDAEYQLEEETPAPFGTHTVKVRANDDCKGASVSIEGGG